MKKFLVIYYASAEAVGAMAKATPEQKMAGMKPWMEWKTKHEDSIVNFGAPLMTGNDRSLEKTWATSGKEISGFSILQGENEDAVRSKLNNHPHLAGGASFAIGVYPFIAM